MRSGSSDTVLRTRSVVAKMPACNADRRASRIDAASEWPADAAHQLLPCLSRRGLILSCSDPVFLAPCGCQYPPSLTSSSCYVTNRWFCRLGEKELQIMICLALWRITDAADQCLGWRLGPWLLGLPISRIGQHDAKPHVTVSCM